MCLCVCFARARQSFFYIFVYIVCKVHCKITYIKFFSLLFTVIRINFLFYFLLLLFCSSFILAACKLAKSTAKDQLRLLCARRAVFFPVDFGTDVESSEWMEQTRYVLREYFIVCTDDEEEREKKQAEELKFLVENFSQEIEFYVRIWLRISVQIVYTISLTIIQ